MEKSNIYKPLFFGMLFYIVILVAFSFFLAVENEQLKDETEHLTAELNSSEIIEEGEILSVEDLKTGGVIYVLYVNENGSPAVVIEVGVFSDLIHTSIEVGDTAIYVRGRNWEDADLLAIRKKESK